MGSSTNGILFYGLCWEDEDVFPWDRDKDYEDYTPRDVGFEDFLCEKLGGPKKPADEVTEDLFSAYLNDREAFLADVPVELVHHCSDRCRMYGLAVKSTLAVARRGSPQKLSSFVVPEGADEVLRKACAALGIDFDAEVKAGCLGWWLTSDWG